MPKSKHRQNLIAARHRRRVFAHEISRRQRQRSKRREGNAGGLLPWEIEATPWMKFKAYLSRLRR